MCVDWTKRKQTKYKRKCATRSKELLEIIYTNMCGPFSTKCFYGENYFIIFINNFSQFGYINKLHEKYLVIWVLEVSPRGGMIVK